MPSSFLAFCKPWFASELKPLSLRPPVSVTRPTLIVFAEEPPPVLLVPPQAASTGSSSIRQVASATRRMRVRDMQSPSPPSVIDTRAGCSRQRRTSLPPARERAAQTQLYQGDGACTSRRRTRHMLAHPLKYYAGECPFLTISGFHDNR